MLLSDVLTEFKDRGDEITVNPLTYSEFYAAYKGEKTMSSFYPRNRQLILNNRKFFGAIRLTAPKTCLLIFTI